MHSRSWILLLPALTVGLAASAQNLVPNDLVLNQQFVTGVGAAVGAEFLPDGRLVIIRQTGQIRVRPAGGGALIDAGTIPVNVSSERGLLGIAVDPLFATSNRVYFYYSEGNDADDRHRVAWATINPATSVVDVAGRTVILSGMYGPANHNGGGITFGPDGLLYVGVGDTGCNCNCAPGQADNWFATCLTNLNGKILRVDRDGNIPPTNPLVGLGAVPACGPPAGASSRPENSVQNGCNAPLYQTLVGAPRTEIYGWGFRNPWRFSFDPLPPHLLWIGDVGEVTWEEITISHGPGEHHGWPFREGQHGDARTSCPTATPQATGECVEPVYEYAHNGGSGSVTGGVFTTHCSWPATYQGRYWFADYTADQRAVWTLVPNATRDGVVANSRANIIVNVEGIVHFTTGPDGALYLVNANFGQIWRLAPLNPVSCAPDAGVPDAGPADTGVHPDAAPGPMDAAPAPDAVIGPQDAMPPPLEDSGVAVVDAAGPGDDAAAPRDDATVAPDDSGVGPNDDAATAPGDDAAAQNDDAAAQNDDATTGPNDSGGGPNDDASAAPVADATAARDASPNTGGTDAGTRLDVVEDGCACATSDDPPPASALGSVALGLGLLALGRRRRPR